MTNTRQRRIRDIDRAEWGGSGRRQKLENENGAVTKVQSTIEEGRNKENSRGIDFARAITREQGDFGDGICGTWTTHAQHVQLMAEKHTGGEKR